MTKDTSKLAQQVFNDASQKILGSPHLQQKLINHIFADFNKQPSISKIRIIEEEPQEQDKQFQVKTYNNRTKHQTLPQPERQAAHIINQRRHNLSIHMRLIYFNSFKSQLEQITKSNSNHADKNIDTKARNLLLKYFCHYCKIFEEMQLQPQTKRLQKDVNRLFTTITIQLFSTLMQKGFRKMLTLIKCLLKVMFVANYFSHFTLTKIKKQVKILTGVRIDQLLQETNRLAYECAFIIKDSYIPINLDKQIQQAQNQIRIKNKQKNQFAKQRKNFTSNTEIISGTPTKRVKLQDNSPKKSNIQMIVTEQQYHPIETQKLPSKRDKKNALSLRTQEKPYKTTSIKLQTSPQRMSPTVKQEQMSMRPTIIMPNNSVSKAENPKVEQPSNNVKIQKNTKAQQKSQKALTHQKPGYRVVETILIDESDEECQTESSPLHISRVKGHPQVKPKTIETKQQQPQEQPEAKAHKIQQSEFLIITQVKQSKTNNKANQQSPNSQAQPTDQAQPANQPINLTFLTQRLSSKFIEDIKKKFINKKDHKDHDGNSGV